MHHYKITSQVFYLVPMQANYSPASVELEKLPVEKQLPQASDALRRRCEINRLDRQIQQAIEKEQFEEAATLRDKRYHLEQKEDA